MIQLTPTAYTFLKNPITSEGTTLLKYTLQEMCLKNMIIVEECYIYVDSRETTKRKRTFLKLSERFKQTLVISEGEQFVLSAVKKNPTLSIAQFKNYLRYHFEKHIDKFKSQYIYPDLKEDNHFFFFIC